MSKLVRMDVDTICDLLRREARSLSDSADSMIEAGETDQADAQDTKALRLRSLADTISNARHVDVVTGRRPKR